jgi:uncharacterized protein with NRDE domain
MGPAAAARTTVAATLAAAAVSNAAERQEAEEEQAEDDEPAEGDAPPIAAQRRTSSMVLTTDAPSRGALTTDFLRGSWPSILVSEKQADEQQQQQPPPPPPPLDYLRALASASERYTGFNLLVGDLAVQDPPHARVAYYSNRAPEQRERDLLRRREREVMGGGLAPAAAAQEEEDDDDENKNEDQGTEDADIDGHHQPVPRALPPGAYGVSNGLIGRWHKVRRALRLLREVLPPSSSQDGGSASSSDAAPAADEKNPFAIPWDALFERVLGDTHGLPLSDHRLPRTGVPPEIEAALSSIFVPAFRMAPDGGAGLVYGTRSQTVVAVRRDGTAELRERYVVWRPEDEAGAAGGGARGAEAERRNEDDDGAATTSCCWAEGASTTARRDGEARGGGHARSWRDSHGREWREVRHAFEVEAVVAAAAKAAAGEAAGA